MEYKHALHTPVWVAFLGKPWYGVIVNRYLEDGKPVYDVRCMDKDADPVQIAMGKGPASMEICGREEYRIHPEKLGAARELYQARAEEHRYLGIMLEDCIRNWENADYLIQRMEKFDEMVENSMRL